MRPAPTAPTTVDPAVHLPPGPRLPAAIQGLGFVTSRRRTLSACQSRYGDAFTLRLPIFGPCVVIADPGLARELFTAGDQVHNVHPNLGRVLGSGSTFALEGTDHRRRRKLLTPPLHGKRIKAYEAIVEDEVRRECANWPLGRGFASIDSMMRITLHVILRAVFGADGHDLDELRRIIPPLVARGSRAAATPSLPRALRALDPNHRLAVARAHYDRVIAALITKSRNDPRLDERDEILALMLASRYDDGSAMSDSDIADELLTLLAAGHETTATTLAWVFERLSRHPEVLADLVAEVDAGGRDLRHAVILETQRSRPVIDMAGRYVVAESLQLGSWQVPRGHNVLVAISRLHDDPRLFDDPDRFDPTRFLQATPPPAWLPFGGGTRRCIGAAFATMEMDVTLRTVLGEFVIAPATGRGEGWHSRGVAYAPRRGGRITVHTRAAGAH